MIPSYHTPSRPNSKSSKTGKVKVPRLHRAGVAGAAAACALAGSIAHAQFTYTPLNLTAGTWNEDMVVEAGAATFAGAVTATMDGGTAATGNTWYEIGQNTAAPTTGLPDGTFTSAANSATEYLMQSYTGKNAVFLNTTTFLNATLTLATPTAVSGLSFLTADGNGAQSVNVTLNFADGTQSISGLSFTSPDWFNGNNVAYNANGRISAGTPFNYNNVNNNNPRLYEEDLTLPTAALGHPISSIVLTFGATSGNSVASIFAVSASGQAPVGNVVWSGLLPNSTPNGSWDTTTQNWQGPTSFLSGDYAIFDDTATGTTNVNIQAGGISPSAVTFNNNTLNYTLSGGAIGAGATLTLNGTGSVTINEANTYTGGTTVNAGSLIVGSNGTLGTGPLAVNNTNTGGGSSVFVSFASPQTVGSLSGTIATASGGTNSATIILNGDLTVNQSITSTFNGTLAGVGNFIVNGTSNSILTLTGTNTYAGSTTVNGGTLNSAAPGDNQQGALPAGQPVIVNNGTLNFATDDGVGYYSGSPTSITLNNSTLMSATGSHSTLPSLILKGSTVTALGAGNVSNNVTTNYILDGGVTTVATSTPSKISAPTILLRGDPQDTGTSGPVTFTVPRGTANTDLIISSAILDKGAGLTKAGNGILQLSGNNSYTGPTSITGGKVSVASSSPFGAGAVSFNDGTTLSLSSVAAIAGFGSFVTNGGATVGNQNGTVVLTDNAANEGRSIFSPAPVSVANGFTATYVYQATGNRQADGIAFVVQNSTAGSTALGSAGGGLGFTGITNSEGLTFNIYTGGNNPVGTNLSSGSVQAPISSAPVNLASGDNISVTVTYDNIAQTLTEKLLDTTTGTTYSNVFTNVNFGTALGANSGYVGFTGGAGGATSYQTVSAFTFNNYTQGATVGNNMSIPAGGTVTFEVAPTSAGGAGSASLTGTITLGAGSTWNVTGGSSTTNTPYTLGGTATALLQGNSSVNVANNGSATGSLTLKAVNDGGLGYSLTKNGPGGLTISGPSTYGGGTVINAGTVAIAHSAALGTGNVTMNGGVLSLSSGGPAVTGFGGFVTNNGASIVDPGTNTTVMLTDNNGGEARSVFSSAPVSIANGFSMSFVYTAAGNRAADGMAFVIQNSPAGSAAVGGTGGGLGYGGQPTGTATGGITNSGALEFNLYTGGAQPIGTGVNYNGVSGQYLTSGPVNLTSGNPIAATVVYNAAAQTLTETLTDQVTFASYSNTFTGVNFSATNILNGTSGYIGFTGGDGGSTSTQTISNFVFNNYSQAITLANNLTIANGVTSGLDVAPATAGGSGTATLTGTLTLGAGSTLNITGGLTPGGALAATGTSYILNIAGDTTLTGNSTINVANNGAGGLALVGMGAINESASHSSLTKTGNGVLYIQGAATYTGPTNINGGTLGLGVSGSLSGTKQINIASGATFDVNGPGTPFVLGSGVSLNGTGPGGSPSAVTGSIDAQSGATVAPGLAGQLALSANATLEAGSTLRFTLGKGGAHSGQQPDLTDYAQLSTTGTDAISGSTLSLAIGSGIQVGDIFTIILTNGSSVTGTFAGVPNLSMVTVSGQTFEINYRYNPAGNFTDLTGTNVALLAVPEPGTLTTLIGGIGLLTGLQRLRRRR